MPTRPGQEERRTLYQSNKSLCHTSRWASMKGHREDIMRYTVITKKLVHRFYDPCHYLGLFLMGQKYFAKYFAFAKIFVKFACSRFQRLRENRDCADTTMTARTPKVNFDNVDTQISTFAKPY